MDTGAARSLLPASKWSKSCKPQPNVRLVAANGSPIPTYGRHHLNLRIGKRTYAWSFVVADVTIPLLGADFLAHYQLLDTASLQATPIITAPDNLALQVLDAADEFAHLRASYPEVFKPELLQQPQTAAKHGIYHHIKTSGPPVYSKFRRLPPDKLAAAKQTRHMSKGTESLGVPSAYSGEEGRLPSPLW